MGDIQVPLCDACWRLVIVESLGCGGIALTDHFTCQLCRRTVRELPHMQRLRHVLAGLHSLTDAAVAECAATPGEILERVTSALAYLRTCLANHKGQ